VIRNVSARLATGVVGSLIGVMLLGTTGVSAKDTRLLYVGDPGQEGNPPSPYEIHPTLVSPGYVSYFDVMIKNEGRQTLTGATLAMGTLIATSDGNGDVGQYLPTGWKINNIVYVGGITPTCVTDGPSAVPATGLITPGSYDGFSCSFGNLGPRANGTIRVYLTAGDSLGASSDLQVSGKVAENVSGNVGGNTNTFYAYGAGNFFLSGDGVVAGLFTNAKISPSKPKDGAPPTTIDITTLTGAYVVSIEEFASGDSGFPSCPSGVACDDSVGASRAHVNFGNSVSPYFVWTMLFQVDPSYKLSKDTGFVHVYDNGTYKIFYDVNQTSCSKPHWQVPCADFSLVTDGSSTYVEVIFKTDVNGTGHFL
jgi:hypothetical protein